MWDSSTRENALPVAVEVSITMAGDDEKEKSRNSDDTLARATMKRVIILTCADDDTEER